MKKITALTISLLLLSIGLMAQVSFEGSKEYGRIFDLTYHPTIPNKVFAVTLGNHIVSSVDNGLTWEVYYSHTPNNQSIKNLKILDANTMSFSLDNAYFNNLQILSLQTNQILKTFIPPIPQDANRTWITDYAIYPQNHDIAIVSQGYSIGFSSFYRVYYTTNGGVSWNTIYSSVDNNSISVNSVAISTNNPQRVYIARGIGPEENYGGLLVSDNAGQTWTEKLVGITVDPIAINPQNPNDLLIGTDASADSENVYRSNDGGLTWESIAINWEDYVTNNIVHIAFNPSNVNAIVVCEENQVIITNDNFQTHTNNVFPEDPSGYYYGLTVTFNPNNSNEILISGNYHPLRSVNGGTTFAKVENPFFVGNTVSLTKQDYIKKHLYYGVQFGYVHHDLETQQLYPYNILPLNFVTSQNSQMVNDPNFIGRVYNFSSSFFGNSLSISNNHGANNMNVPFNHQYLITVTSQSATPHKIWTSFLEGDLDGNEGSIVYEIDFSNPDNITTETIALPAFDVVSAIYTNPSNYNIKLIALGSRIFRTIDNGTTWQNSSNGLESYLSQNDFIFKIVDNPLNANQITITTSQGIFTSYDNGNNWELISGAIAQNVMHSNLNDGVLVATSFTTDYSVFSLFYTTNMGGTWETINPSIFFNSYILSADYNFINQEIEIFVATTDLGILKYDISIENLDNPNFVESNTIELFPNPTKNQLTINSKQNINHIELYDVLGKKLQKNEISNNFIDVSNWTKGIYIIKVFFQNGKYAHAKFIKE
ncbi:T9SS type A sorting domain-containing protein [Flavobacterium sedimenticola]|uniref:T9SS type A sorting domain-containing protein n=1 Tax=Flavobacterium sedimenticola TaxID=3043286 RepID=A0ABT6XS04_9FLAO|nr:T9SS type A sorting domain-containing protein [Flavobacterium sedimenticola]MDI9257877.1 T9SS type A sorting domain-containing protein [Flavobacterium sedimenticola]